MTRVAPRARRAAVLGLVSVFWLSLGPSHARPGGWTGGGTTSLPARERLARLAELRTSIESARAAGDITSEADALLEVGRAHLDLADLPAARRALSHAIDRYRLLGDRRAEATALDLRGTVNLTLASPQASRADLEQALALRRSTGDRAGEAQTLSNLGLLFASIGDDEGALERNEQAWQLFRSVGHESSAATVLHNLAEVYLRLGDGGRALEYGRLALDLHRRHGPQSGVAHTLEHIASAYGLLGNAHEASRHYELALDASRTLTSRWIEAGVLARLGALHLASGAPDRAERTLVAALDAARAVGNRLGEAGTLAELGRALVAQRRDREAGAQLTEALAIGRALESARLQVQALAGLADLASAQGDWPTALAHSEAVLSALDDARGGARRDDVRVAMSAAHDDHLRRHVDILMVLHAAQPKGGYAVRAYATVERARARTLLETLADARGSVTGGASPELTRLDLRLRQEIGAKAERLSRLLSRAASPTDVAALRRDVDALVAAFHQNRARIREEHPAYAALVHPDPIGLDDVQRTLLDPESVLVQFSLGRSRSFVWAVSADEWMVAELPGRLEVEGLIRRAYALLTARGTRQATDGQGSRAARIAAADREWASLSRLLSRVLLAPIAPLLGRARIIIVGDGAIDYLPFSALPDPTSQSGMPLLNAHEIVRLPSASVLAALRQRREGATPYRTVAVVADPVFSAGDSRVRVVHRPLDSHIPELPRLRFSRTEAVAIAGLAAPGQSALALDFEAARERIVEGRFAGYDILHLATHGTLDTDRPELSGLVFSTVDGDGNPRDGHLRLVDIYNLPVTSDLVVLSGCETALGQRVRGEGVVGLTRGFLHAGASRVISSFWKVDDTATSALMSRLYHGLLRDHRRPARALRDAQLALARRDQWSGPYYWAAFELSGEWR
ncbi:MAG: CHAT domain-containing protein [Acidobacteriota bacterium]